MLRNRRRINFRKLRSAAGILALWLGVAAGDAFAAAPSGYYLVWSDEFNGASLDLAKWDYWLLGNRREAVNVTNAVSLNGSNMVITTYTSGGTHFTAMVANDTTFRTKYGYWETSIRWGDSNGMWSAYWMQSPTMGAIIADPQGSGSEIDICEHRFVDGSTNNISNQIQANLHWNGYGTSHQSQGSGNTGSGLATGFHTYGFLWTPNSYSFRIDGSQFYSGGSSPVSHSTEWLIFSSEVDDSSTTWAGFIPPGGYGSLATSTTKLTVDYARYYAPTSTLFWTGAGSLYWTNNANWISNLPPSSISDLTFSYLGGNNNATILGQDYTIHGLTALETKSALSVNGPNTLTLGAGGIDAISQSITLNSPVALNASQNWSAGSGHTIFVNGGLSGANALTKSGYGTLRLNSSNSFSGTLFVDSNAGGSLSDGTVLVAHPGALANVASPIFIQNGNSASSTLQLDAGGGNITVTQALQIACRNNTVANLRNTGGVNTLANNLAIMQGGSNVVFQSDSGQLNINGSISYVGSLVGNRMWNFQGNGNTVVSGQMPAAANGSIISLGKGGAGTLTLSNANTFTGNTRPFSGTLRLGHVNALQNSTVDLNAVDTGRIDFGALTAATFGGLTGLRDLSLTNAAGAPVALTTGNNNSYSDFGGALKGPGDFVKTGSGTTILSGTNTYSGATLVNSGILRPGPNTNLTAALQPLLWLTFDSVSGATVNNTGTGGAALNGTLNGAGATIVAGGRYGNALNLNGTGGSVRVNNRVTSLDGNTAGVSWTLALWIKTSQAGAGYAYQGDGSWVSGNTAFYLNQGNASSGTRAGAVRWGGGWLTGNAALNNNLWHFLAITVNNGAKTIYVDGSVDATFPATTWPNASTGNQFWIGGTGDSGDGVLAMNGMIDEVYVFSRALNQTEVQTIMSNQPVACATCYVGKLPSTTAATVADDAMLDLNGIEQTIASLSGSGVVTNSGATATTLTLSGSSGTFDFNGRLGDSSALNAINLVKSGGSTQIFSGLNNYHGTTAINGGTLVVQGSLGTSLVTVSGGTLGGNGSIDAPVTIQPGGTIAPGASIGTLTISNSLTLAGTTFVEVDAQAETNDQLVVMGTLSFGGDLVVTNLAGAFTAGTGFKLFSAANYTGAFAGINPITPGPGLIWNTNTLTTDGTLRIDLSPPVLGPVSVENGAVILQGAGGVPGGGYSLWSSTNLLLPVAVWDLMTTGLLDLTGGFSYTNLIDPADAQRFFLLREP